MKTTRNAVFFALAAIIAVLMAQIWSPVELPGPVFLVLGGLFGLLGLVLVILTFKLGDARMPRTFFLLTGISAAAIPLCAILHNLVYALFIVWFGEDFWGPDGDEPVFFILAVFVFPVLFLIGWLGSLVLMLKQRMATLV